MCIIYNESRLGVYFVVAVLSAILSHFETYHDRISHDLIQLYDILTNEIWLIHWSLWDFIEIVDKQFSS